MAGSSSYLAPDTYHSMSTADDELIFLHTMLRASNLEKTMSFFEALGLQETRRKDSEKGKYTLVFMATSKGAPEIEITYNWGDEEEVFGTFCIT
jgi:catechol 2,3-dioxygenase-like lactoylglutathione lyase family enzyme|tara:strand:- start:1282 stop:1563 length:282 start_codon:yes stop_codon:yes gene_type:complete